MRVGSGSTKHISAASQPSNTRRQRCVSVFPVLEASSHHRHTLTHIQDAEKEERIFEISHSRGCKLLSKSQASSSGRWKQAASSSVLLALGGAGREACNAGSARSSSTLRTGTTGSRRMRRQPYPVFAVRPRTLQTVNKQISISCL